MKKRPTPTNEKPSACQDSSVKFTGTDNPRHLRAIAALLKRPTSRKEMDSTAGCANTPQMISDICKRGLEIKCERIEFIDRDGRRCRPGVYYLTDQGRRAFWAWKKAATKKGGV